MYICIKRICLAFSPSIHNLWTKGFGRCKKISNALLLRGVYRLFFLLLSWLAIVYIVCLFVWSNLFINRHVNRLTYIPCVGDCLIVRDQLKYSLSFHRSVKVSNVSRIDVRIWKFLNSNKSWSISIASGQPSLDWVYSNYFCTDLQWTGLQCILAAYR